MTVVLEIDWRDAFVVGGPVGTTKVNGVVVVRVPPEEQPLEPSAVPLATAAAWFSKQVGSPPLEQPQYGRRIGHSIWLPSGVAPLSTQG
jgi:hypothetical protein